MNKKRVVVSVTNDLATDQRVARTCSVFHDLGWEIVLVGRILPNSMPIQRPYRCVRFRLWFSKGALFYAVYNIRLFFFLLFNRCDLLFSNDLDTLLPNFLISTFKRCPLIYDSHEYFTEVPEIQGRPIVKKTWQLIEKICLMRMKSMITVNNSIADLFRNKYPIEVAVIRNVSTKKQAKCETTRTQLGLPMDKFIIILQGAGINVDRGAEEAVESMQFIQNAILLIIGSGDVVPQLKKYVEKHDLSAKVWFVDKQPAEILRQYTALSDIGLSLDKPLNINYEFSLPNKLFDYIQAGIAVVASNLVEVASIVKQYQVGEVLTSYQPKEIALTIEKILADKVLLNSYKTNATIAADVLCWEYEQKILVEIIQKVVEKSLKKSIKN